MNTNNLALFIIDMQNDFVLTESPSCIAGAKGTVPNIVKILSKFRENKLPVFHIFREHREDGSDIEMFRYKDFVGGKKYAIPNTNGCEIISELTQENHEYKIVKNRFSGFMKTELDFILRRLNISKIVVTGTQYPNCIRATIFDAIALGYETTVITDATSAATEDVAQANIVDLINVGVSCINSDEFII